MTAVVFVGFLSLALVFAGPFLWSDRARRGPVFFAAAALLCAISAFGAAAAQEFPRPSWFGQALLLLEGGLMLLAGATMFHALALASGQRWSGLVIRGVLPLLCIAAPAVLMGWLSEALWLRGSVAVWGVLTSTGLAVYFRQPPERRQSALRSYVLVPALAFMLVHCVQLLQLLALWPQLGKPVFFVTPALLLLILGLATLLLSRLVIPRPPEYRKSGLSQTAAQGLFARIDAEMRREKLFLDPACSRDLVAQRVQVTPRAVGEAVNRGAGQPFAAYVRMLQDPNYSAVSLEAIGLSCGFQSRSAFYEAFKAQFGVSPGQWRADQTCDEKAVRA